VESNICAALKRGMAGHTEKYCGLKQKTAKEMLLSKYSEVCHRCGNKGGVALAASCSSPR